MESYKLKPADEATRTAQPTAAALASPVQQMADQSPRTVQARERAALMQRAAWPNRTGLPDRLKAGIESLSCMRMDHVRVHYGSAQPAQFHAHAFAQGPEIHLAPGQEHHLPHEAWHVVQQAQGRVTPTARTQRGVPLNDDRALEAEADTMGARAIATGHAELPGDRALAIPTAVAPVAVQAKKIVGLDGTTREVAEDYVLGEGESLADDVAVPEETAAAQHGGALGEAANMTAHGGMARAHARIEQVMGMPDLMRLLLHFAGPSGERDIPALSKTLYHSVLRVRQEDAQRRTNWIRNRKLAYAMPSLEWAEADRHADAQHAEQLVPLLKAAIRETPQGKATSADVLDGMNYRQLELMHAKLVYTKGTLTKIPSMKDVAVPPLTSFATHFDVMRAQVISKQPLSAQTESLLQQLMPKLQELTHRIRLTHYYDAASEEPILRSGRLQSKARRMLRAGGKQVPNKSCKLDDALGNIDHVFFFAEYEEDDEHRAPFRNTRFGGKADESDATLNQKSELDGTERRVSFPLNQVPVSGMHGYTKDLNSLPNLDAVHNVFSGAPPAGANGKPQHDETTLGGVDLLMDLLRQRFKASQFPGSKKSKTPEKMVNALKAMSLSKLHKFLFRRHPGLDSGDEMNPQILVPGSVPFTTPGVRFDSPPGHGK